MSKNNDKPIIITFDPSFFRGSDEYQVDFMSLDEENPSVERHLSDEFNNAYERLNTLLLDKKVYPSMYYLPDRIENERDLADIARLCKMRFSREDSGDSDEENSESESMAPENGPEWVNHVNQELLELRNYFADHCGIRERYLQNKVILSLMQGRAGAHYRLFEAMLRIFHLMPGNITQNERFGIGNVDANVIKVYQEEDKIFFSAKVPLKVFNPFAGQLQGRVAGSMTLKWSCSASTDIEVMKDFELKTAKIRLDPSANTAENVSSLVNFFKEEFDAVSNVRIVKLKQQLAEEFEQPQLMPRRANSPLPLSSRLFGWVKRNKTASILISAFVIAGVIALGIGFGLATAGLGTPLGLFLSVVGVEVALTDTAMVFLSALISGIGAGIVALISRGINKAHHLRVACSNQPKELVIQCRPKPQPELDPLMEADLRERNLIYTMPSLATRMDLAAPWLQVKKEKGKAKGKEILYKIKSAFWQSKNTRRNEDEEKGYGCEKQHQGLVL